VRLAEPAALRALVLEHERETPGGLILQWLEERAAYVDEVRIDIDERDLDPTGYGLIVSLGSEFAAYDDSLPFVNREKNLLRAAVDASVPVLGVCFGAQLLARTLGGEVFPAERGEIGWLPVRTHDREVVAEGPWFQWHFDTFTIPPGATLLAETDVGPQAFSVGRSLGLQFHPEVTPEIMATWVAAYGHELDAEGVDPGGLLRQTEERRASSRNAAWHLLNRVSRRGGGDRGGES
jgi:GMP synthase (glutamine-hydrolysing)